MLTDKRNVLPSRMLRVNNETVYHYSFFKLIIDMASINTAYVAKQGMDVVSMTGSESVGSGCHHVGGPASSTCRLI